MQLKTLLRGLPCKVKQLLTANVARSDLEWRFVKNSKSFLLSPWTAALYFVLTGSSRYWQITVLCTAQEVGVGSMTEPWV